MMIIGFNSNDDYGFSMALMQAAKLSFFSTGPDVNLRE